MRGIKAVLLEQRDLAFGTSSRFHGLLHSGGRYVVKDAAAARECIEENYILRKIASHCVEGTEGFFVRLPEDDADFARQWVKACQEVGIPAVPLTPAEAVRLEPNLTARIAAAYRVPDSAIDGFRLCWQNVASARRYGGEVYTYSEAVGIALNDNRVAGVTVRNTLTGQLASIACDYIINAAGSWSGNVAALAGIQVNVRPDRGTLVAFNHRFTNRVINRLRPPEDGDIFVPHGSITIFGTTSSAAEKPGDITPRTEEVRRLLAIGEAVFEDLPDYRILRAFTGTRPLYSACDGAQGRAVSRNFAIIDHEPDGVTGLITIVGGKLTTYRLMAEKITDCICDRLGVSAACRTAEEPLMADAAEGLLKKARGYFPAYGVELAAGRLGPLLGAVVERIEANPAEAALVCECEMVTLAEIRAIAAERTSYNLGDVRRRTRMGMGTCQGAFCGFRCAGALEGAGLTAETTGLLREFLEERWNGIRPVLWGKQLREEQLLRSIYCASLNIDGAIKRERI
jgi:glycerol-3-phosphate dehydrogenase